MPRSREPMVSSNSLVAMALLTACMVRPYTLEINYNSGEEIMENIKQVVLSLVEGLAIAVLVLWLFLGEWKASAIVAISMPLSVLTALIIMAFMGMTINMMSLGGGPDRCC